MKLDNDGTGAESWVDLRAFFEQQPLRFLRTEMPGMHEPAQGDRCTSSAARFAVHVDRPAARYLLVDERHGPFNVREPGRREIDRRNSELHDSRLFVRGPRPGVLFARVHDGPDTEFRQGRDIPGERQSAHDEPLVDSIPPVARVQHSGQEQVPGQGWEKQDSRSEPTHGEKNTPHPAGLQWVGPSRQPRFGHQNWKQIAVHIASSSVRDSVDTRKM